MSGLTRMRVYVREYTGIDIGSLDCDEALAAYEEAKIVRSLRVAVMQEAVVRAFKG